MNKRFTHWRLWTALVVCITIAAWFLLGWHLVPGNRYMVRDSAWLRVVPLPLDPGWHWVPPILMTVRSLPREPTRERFILGFDDDHPVLSPEGARQAVAGVVVWEVVEENLSRLVMQAPDDLSRTVIRPALDHSFGQFIQSGGSLVAGDGEEQFHSLLASRLGAMGISLISLGVDVSGTPERVHHLLGERELATLPPNRILLVGWDGADWNIIDPLLAAGELPNLASLLDRGTRHRLRTVTPVLSPVVWTSMATGTMPEKHGIIDFLALDPGSGSRVPVTSNLRQMPAFWTLLAQRELAVGVVAWWATWPAEKVPGYMVTDRVAYQLFGMEEQPGQEPAGKTWPPDLYDEMAPLMVKPDEVTAEDLDPFISRGTATQLLEGDDAELLRSLQTVVAATRTYHGMALHLARLHEVVLQAVYYEATDTAAHLFMPFASPAMPGITEEQAQVWGQVVNAAYRDLDQRLGELLAAAGPETTVVLASDHGFRTGENRPAGSSRIGEGRAAEWHRKYGILVMSGPGIRPQGGTGDASVLDVAPTVLALLGLPVPAQMDGKVLVDALEPDFLRRYPPVVQGGPGLLDAGVPSPVASEADDAIVQRLRTLGYVGSDDVGRLVQDDATSFNNRAAMHLAAGDGEEALLEVDRGLAMQPDSSSLLVNKARALRLLEREQEALEILMNVLTASPELAPVENLVGNIYMDRGDLTEAAVHFSRALEQDPNSSEVLNSRGLLAEREGRLPDALADFQRATAIDPDSAEAHNNIGNVYRGQALQAAARGDDAAASGAYGQAESAYRDGMKADPEFVGSYNNLALIYQDTGRPEAAMALYQRALQEDPQQAVVHNNLGSLYFASGRLEEARDEFAAAIATEPDYAAAWNNLGAVKGRLGDPQGELAAYGTSVELDPDYADGFHNLGLALLQRGDLQGAEQALLRSLALQPDYVSACVALGELYLHSMRHQEAVAILTRALAINPGLVAIHNRLGEAWLVAGDRDQAAAAWERSLELNSQQPQVREQLLQLED